jgi:CheY-like chemotaxis protein
MKNINKLLLIDDDEDDQEIFKMAVGVINPAIELSTASNGLIGLRMLQSGELRPDVIFLDLNMPRMNGKDFLKQVKTSVDLSDIPVVIYTTSSNELDKQETKQLGAISFLTKPDRIQDIVDQLTTVIVTA